MESSRDHIDVLWPLMEFRSHTPSVTDGIIVINPNIDYLWIFCFD